MHPFFTLNGKEQNHNNLACCKKYLGQQPVDLIFLTTESANQLHSVVAIEVEGNKSQALQSKKEGVRMCVHFYVLITDSTGWMVLQWKKIISHIKYS